MRMPLEVVCPFAPVGLQLPWLTSYCVSMDPPSFTQLSDEKL